MTAWAQYIGETARAQVHFAEAISRKRSFRDPSGTCFLRRFNLRKDGTQIDAQKQRPGRPRGAWDDASCKAENLRLSAQQIVQVARLEDSPEGYPQKASQRESRADQHYQRKQSNDCHRHRDDENSNYQHSSSPVMQGPLPAHISNGTMPNQRERVNWLSNQ